MVRIIGVSLFTFLFLMISCKETSKKTTLATAKNELPVYNFEELSPLLHQTDGKTYVVNFWATWCAPCIKELPYFEAIHHRYRDERIEVILVSLDFPDKIESLVKPFIAKHKLKSTVVILDDPHENEWIPKVDSTWSGAIPATLIYKKHKRRFYEQSFTEKELFNAIDNFLKP